MTSKPFLRTDHLSYFENVEKDVIVLRLAINDYRPISFSKEIPAGNV